MMHSPNSTHLERWLGRANIEHVSKCMNGFYGPKPIALGGVPGVYVKNDGDFIGECKFGEELSAYDRAEILLKRVARAGRAMTRENRAQLNMSFSSLSDLISEVTGGKRWQFDFQKVGTTGVLAATNSLWGVGNQPISGGAASAAPGGRACSSTTVGAFPYTNASGGDTMHIVSAWPIASAINTLLLYDRIFDVAKTMASTGTEAVTGVPTRYQSTTATDADAAAGNFLFVETQTALANTAHNWTVCTYTDESGNTGATLPSLTGNAQNIVNRLDHPINQWFAPLASGDYGIKALTQMQCSASVATGAINFVIGHPLVWMPCQVAGLMFPVDLINTSFGLPRAFDSACFAFLEVSKPATTATTYTGSFVTGAG